MMYQKLEIFFKLDKTVMMSRVVVDLEIRESEEKCWEFCHISWQIILS